MSVSDSGDGEFDLRPDPRILPMLGEINLSPPRCLAEFIDNCVDGFLSIVRGGGELHDGEVALTIPTNSDSSARITIRDNGPGMTQERLERSVRAGWTSNDPIHNLGMFGMGFNIATARLGSVTEVWTTKANAPQWFGLEIDFEKLVQQKHFRTPRLTRAKPDPQCHGTEVIIGKLKPVQRDWFAKAANRTRVRKELGRLYSSMLRSNGVPTAFRLTLNDQDVPARNHCVWGDEDHPRNVDTSRFGTINASQSVNITLPDRLYCAKCWQWLPPHQTDCPACESDSEVVQRPRRIHGWIGVQRYLSRTDFGVDFLRHGRKIEIANKDLFMWSNGDSQEVEYPIDDPRSRGRLVGEIHLDHCRVTYMKDTFDRSDPAWAEMVGVVRGEGPLRPDKGRELGFGQNTSPLFCLFQAFRRSSPKPKVAGCYAKLLVVPDNGRAEEMAKRFYAGEQGYQPDDMWWELVQEADSLLLVGDGSAGGAGSGTGLGGFGGSDDASEEPNPLGDDLPPEPTIPERVPMPSLSREYHFESASMRWNISAFAVQSGDPALGGPANPWTLKRLPAGSDEFLVNTEHDVFRSATMTPLDALLTEIAGSVVDFTRDSQNAIRLGDALAVLRERYAGLYRLDPIALSGEASVTLAAVARSLQKHVSAEDSKALFAELTPSDREAIQRRMAIRSVSNPDQVIQDGRFLEFAQRTTLVLFIETHPELFFDGKCWEERIADLGYEQPAAAEEARRRTVLYYSHLLADAIWLDDQDPSDLECASRERLLRAALSLELLTPVVGDD